jgi:hypothetical protein
MKSCRGSSQVGLVPISLKKKKPSGSGKAVEAINVNAPKKILSYS